VNSSHFGRSKQLLFVMLAEPGNVFCKRTGKQLNVLRKISDIGAKLIAIPMSQLRSVNSDFPNGGSPHPNQRSCQAGLTCCVRTYNSQDLTRLQNEGDFPDNGLFSAGRNYDNILD
jgi:hypothetical protein